MGGLCGLGIWLISGARRIDTRDAELLFQFSPVAFFETIEAGSSRGGAGVNVAIETFVTLSHLLPLAYCKAVAVMPRH